MPSNERPAPSRSGTGQTNESVWGDAETLTETQSDAIPTWEQHRENWKEAETWLERQQREGGDR
jgi:hypothetical protein